MSNAYAQNPYDAFDEFDLDADFADASAPGGFPAADGDINPREPLQFTAMGGAPATVPAQPAAPAINPVGELVAGASQALAPAGPLVAPRGEA